LKNKFRGYSSKYQIVFMGGTKGRAKGGGRRAESIGRRAKSTEYGENHTDWLKCNAGIWL
jgi:hypothetical protein